MANSSIAPKLISVLLLSVFIFGCQQPPKTYKTDAPRFKVTFIYPDGAEKIFEGCTIQRNNNSGEWDYLTYDEAKKKSVRKFFSGKTLIEPIPIHIEPKLTPPPPVLKAEEEPDPQRINK